ncbi:glycosyltransferase [Persicobacter psychrovividus]|uniref:Glycosyl transferase family 2 n=1 Tax=Persicobacter psychrovividus TaxID=387638 RepID=A0ABN6L4U3_9BACT|nr:glycosyl transferase family 2 [Persicobacter psychrovividus]
MIKTSGNPWLFFFLTLWFACGLLQWLYHIGIFSRLYWQKPLAFRQKANYPRATVVVAVHNEAHNLPSLLKALQVQEYPQAWELLIVNDRSTDRTGEILQQAKKWLPNLRVYTIPQTPEGISPKKYAIQQGIRNAQYDRLIFTDADCIPQSPHWLQKMGKHLCEGPQFVLGYSPYEYKQGFLNLFIRFETLLTGISYLSIAMWGNPYMGVGRNLAYTKKTFTNHGGFDRHQHVLSGDDDLFVNERANKNNTRWEIHPDAFVVSKPATSWQEFIHQKTRHLSAGNYYQWKDRLILGGWIMSKVIFYAFLIPFILILGLDYYLISYWLLTTFIIGFSNYLASKKLDEKISYMNMVILDHLYVIYYVLIGLRALFTKQTQWNHHLKSNFQPKH